MKKALLICAALMLVSGGVYAINYTYIGVNLGWSNKAAWDNGSGASRAYPVSGDVVMVNNGQTLNLNLDSTHNYVCGQFTMDGSATTLNPGDTLSSGISITTDATNGTTGDFLLKSGTLIWYRIKPWTLNVHGNTLLANSAVTNWGQGLTLNAYGNNKYLKWDTALSNNTS